MGVLNIEADARRCFDVVKAGGTAIFPVDVGYTIVGGSREALSRIFATKQRGEHKRNAMVCDMVTERDLHMLDGRGRAMVETITGDYDLPLGVIAPYRPDHPLIRKLHEDSLKGSTVDGTLAVLVNAGPFHAAITRLSREEEHPIFGSSANLTGTGVKYRVEDIQQPLLDITDIVIDYGLRKYHHYRRSSTLINFATMEVVRIGTCYELISDILRRHFGHELPPDPGMELLPGGGFRDRLIAAG